MAMLAERRGGRVARWVLIAVAVVGLTLLIWRGLVRAFAPDGLHDLAAIYGPARAWLEGLDPYSGEAVEQVLREAGYDGIVLRYKRSMLGVYPPITYAAMAPIAAMNWRAASITWTALSLAGVGVLIAQCVWLLRRTADITQNPNPRLRERLPLDVLAVVAAVLALAPFHTSLRLGQTSIVALVLTLGAFIAVLGARQMLAGVLAGLAFALKPQMGIVAGAYFVTRMHGRAVGFTLLTAGALYLVGWAQVAANAPQWQEQLQRNLQVFNEGGYGDPTMAGRFRHHLLSLHVLLHMLIEDRKAVTVLTVAFGAVVTLLAMGCMAGRRTCARQELAFFSVLAVACLLTAPGHRFYNAMLLLVPMVYGLSLLWRGMDGRTVTRADRLRAAALLAPVVSFVVPTSSALYVLGLQGYIPAALMDNIVWHGLLMPLHVWTLLLLLALLLWYMRLPDGMAVATPQEDQTGTADQSVSPSVGGTLETGS